MVKIKEVVNPKFGLAFKRISQAIHKYAPSDVIWTSNDNDADIIIMHTVGGEEYLRIASLPRNKVVNIQHCVFTTGVTLPMWTDLWKSVRLNISFHDLSSYTNEKFSFYRTPWGADSDFFHKKNIAKVNKIVATGHVAGTECLDLVFSACRLSGKTMHHTGENFKWDSRHYQYHGYMEGESFVDFLNKAQYISGLRKIEGFELMGIEGAMCGAIPIVPNEPTYDFYKDFGIFVDTRKSDTEIVDQLVPILSRETQGLEEDKIEYVRETFSWSVLVPKIFNAILS